MNKELRGTTMALDNPSYFSLLGDVITSDIREVQAALALSSSSSSSTSVTSATRSLSTLFKKKPCKIVTSKSSSVLGITTAATVHQENSRNVSSSIEEREPMLTRQTSHPTNGPRRSFRGLFRSLSSNTGTEKTLQILKGNPRPSDVAPPSPYLPHRSHSHSDHDRRNRPIRRRVLKSASELLSNDMVFCSEDAVNCNRVNGCKDQSKNNNEDDDDTGEVFLGVNDARYYNLSAIQATHGASRNRRHSIGTFCSKEQNTVILTKAVIQNDAVINEPDAVAPSISVDQVDGIHQQSGLKLKRPRNLSRKSSRSRSGGTKLEGTNASFMEEREDVVFVSSKDSEASALWVNYLTACFEQISRQQGRPPFKIRHVAVEDAASISSTIQDKISKARLQIIIVCPILLEKASNKSEQASTLAKQLIPDRVLAMMLGVHDGHLTESQKNALVSYSQWQKFFVKDQDETFVGQFLGAAITILGNTSTPAIKSDKTTFSVHPKKVKMGQNRILVILNDPLRPEDIINVIVDRCGDGIEINQVKKRNPYTLQFSIPERCLEVSMLIGVRVIINEKPQGVRQVKCESRLRELDQILRAHDNPLEFMCQTFGFNPGDREQLDNWMVHAFQKNLPPRFHLLATPSGSVPLQRNIISPEEYPTLLHFAARFGLEKLAWQLLDCPGGELACDLKNVSEFTPADLAEQAGHTKLAHQLRGYMQMNEFTNMYSYLKVISENTSGSRTNNENTTTNNSNNPEINEHNKDDYCQPRPLSEAYLVPPAARPVITSAMITNIPPQLPLPNPTSPTISDMNYSIVPPPTPVFGSITNQLEGFDAISMNLPLQGYLKMHPAGPKTSSSINAPITTPLLTTSKASPLTQCIRKDNSNIREDSPSSNASNVGSLPRSISNQGNKSRDASGPQDELLEIITDFKNNVFTISEVERLVENWRNRNDVQQSFKDKQRQLAAMRDEYERIQKKLKEEMKTPTPFDRIKKFFTKSKKEPKDSTNQDDDTASTNSKTDKSNGSLSDRRPISSLSCHSLSSSSSSGRMSTISGCSGTSVGDSGTHSDTEDRRLRNIREDKGGMMTYEIPPAPKPFTGRYSPMRYTPLSRSSSQCSEEQRRNNFAGSTDQYYISFPVSGLPIHSYNPDGSPIEPKTPCSPCDHHFPTSMSIPEEQSHTDINENIENQTEIKEMNHLSPTSSPPSPPTYVPLDYINIKSDNIPTNDLQNNNLNSNTNDNGSNSNSKTNNNDNSPCDNEKYETTMDISKIQNNEPVRVINGNQTIVEQNSSESSQGIHSNLDHVATIPLDVDVVDAPLLHEYMNIQSYDQDPKVVGMIPKKPPAPPVPPRVAAAKK